MNIFKKLHNKFFFIVTPIILKRSYLRSLHILTLKYSRFWHPYVDCSSNNFKEAVSLLKTINQPSLQLTNTGVLQIYSTRKVYMIPFGLLSSESLSKNYQNWVTLKDSIYYELVDYKLVKESLNAFVYYNMDKLEALPRCDENKARKSIIDTFNKPEKEMLLDYIDVFSALEKLNLHCQINASQVKSILTKSNLLTQVGPTHGDLTPSNILVKKNGEVVIIDLDRFEMSGAQFIDEIHFHMESTGRILNKNWLELLPKRLAENTFPKELLIGYFFYRLNAEIREDIVPTKNYLRQLSLATTRILTLTT